MQRWLVRFKLFAVSLVGRTRKLVVGRDAIAIVTQSEHGLFAIDPEDMSIGRELRKTRSYGDDELRRVFAHVGPNDDVLVVGAHIGTLVVPIACRCRSVVAIEANPDNYRLLTLNLFLNKIENVRAFNIAASDKTEMLEFVSSRTNSGGAKRMPKIRAFEYFYDSPKTISVQARALDEHLKGETFSLVFMDIEGSEYFAMKGMQNILRNARTLFVEYLPHHLRNVSGVSPKEFLSGVTPYFENLLIPSQGLRLKSADCLPALQAMFDREQGDDGLIFTK